MADIVTTDSSDLLTLTTPDGNNTEDYSQQDGCYGYLPTNTLFLYLSIPSFVLIVLGSFFKRRKQRMLDLCGGRPGMMQPIDTLDPFPSRRFTYAAAFGMTTQLCLNLFLGQHLPTEFMEKAEVGGINIGSIFRIICIIIYTIAIYPIFAAIYEDAILGYAVTTLYVWLIFGLEIFNIVFCIPDLKQDLVDSAPANESVDSFVASNLPLYMSTYFVRLIPTFAYELYLAISIPVRLVRCIQRRTRLSSHEHEKEKDIKKAPAYIHVKDALTKKLKETILPDAHPPLKIRIRDYLYPPAPGYHYSVRVICTFVVASTTIYMLGVDSILDFAISAKQWDASMDTFEEELGTPQIQAALSLLGGFIPIPINAEGQSDIKGTYRIFKIVFIVSQTLAIFTALISILFALAAVRNDIIAVYRGKRDKIPPSNDLASHSLVVGSLKYSGLQIAYLVWAFLAHFGIFFAIGMAIGLLTLWEGIWKLLFTLLKKQWVTVLTTIFIIVFQILMARFVLTQQGKLALNNRKFYFNLIYIMFFYNIIVGLFSCLLRIIKAVIVGIIFLPRLDQSLMPERFEMQDPGFSAYVGYVHVENAHTNPVLLMFCYFLTRSLGNQRTSQSSSPIRNDKVGNSNGSIRPTGIKLSMLQRKEIVRRRYWLWFTLLQNPSMRLHRKHNAATSTSKEDANAKEIV